MATIADYIIVADLPHTLKAGDSKVFEITLPQNIYRGQGEAKPILAYIAEPIMAQNLTYEIVVEDSTNIATKIKTGSLTGNDTRGLWEAFKLPGDSKKIKVEFKVISGSGEVKFQDIVLWFQRVSQL